MPRQARLDIPGTLHPVMIRGIEKRQVNQATKRVPASLAAGGESKDRGRLGRELRSCATSRWGFCRFR